MQGVCNDLTSLMGELYTKIIGKASQLLTLNVSDSTSYGLNDIWGKVTDINNDVFQPIALTLVVLFFLIGFCATSVDAKQELRFETVFKMFFKLAITEGLVCYSLDITKSLFDFGSRFASLMVNNTNQNGFNSAEGLRVDAMIYGFANPIYDMHSSSRIVFLLVALIGVVVAVACGGIIFIKAFMRIVKLVLVVPFGTLALSTVAGGGSQALAGIVPAYYKFVISTIFEAVSMAFGMYLCQKINYLIRTDDILGLKEVCQTYINSGQKLAGASLMVGVFCITCFFNVLIINTSQTVASNALGLRT